MKSDWKTLDFPNSVKELKYERNFTESEMEVIKHGLIPVEMEDRWFIYFENNLLCFHRSWTGHKIYEIIFSQNQKIKNVIVNRDDSEYNMKDDAFDIKQLDYLINKLLSTKRS